MDSGSRENIRKDLKAGHDVWSASNRSGYTSYEVSKVKHDLDREERAAMDSIFGQDNAKESSPDGGGGIVVFIILAIFASSILKTIFFLGLAGVMILELLQAFRDRRSIALLALLGMTTIGLGSVIFWLRGGMEAGPVPGLLFIHFDEIATGHPIMDAAILGLALTTPIFLFWQTRNAVADFILPFLMGPVVTIFGRLGFPFGLMRVLALVLFGGLAGVGVWLLISLTEAEWPLQMILAWPTLLAVVSIWESQLLLSKPGYFFAIAERHAAPQLSYAFNRKAIRAYISAPTLEERLRLKRDFHDRMGLRLMPGLHRGKDGPYIWNGLPYDILERHLENRKPGVSIEQATEQANLEADHYQFMQNLSPSREQRLLLRLYRQKYPGVLAR